MFEAELTEGNVLKKIVDSIKDIVNNVNLEAGPNGITMQAMDPTHVALVSMELKSEGFDNYRADKNFQLGIKLNNLHKILKCAKNNDAITLSCKDDPSQLTLQFASDRKYSYSWLNSLRNFGILPVFCGELECQKINLFLDQESSFNLNLMTLDAESLNIPATTYSSQIVLPSGDFARTCKELSQLSENGKNFQFWTWKNGKWKFRN